MSQKWVWFAVCRGAFTLWKGIAIFFKWFTQMCFKRNNYPSSNNFWKADTVKSNVGDIYWWRLHTSIYASNQVMLSLTKWYLQKMHISLSFGSWTRSFEEHNAPSITYTQITSLFLKPDPTFPSSPPILILNLIKSKETIKQPSCDTLKITILAMPLGKLAKLNLMVLNLK